MNPPFPRDIEAEIEAAIAGIWHVQNPDKGQDLREPGARLIIAGSYEFGRDRRVAVRRVFRDGVGGQFEEAHDCDWRYHSGNRIVVAYPGPPREVFSLLDDGRLSRVIALFRVWEDSLILHKA